MQMNPLISVRCGFRHDGTRLTVANSEILFDVHWFQCPRVVVERASRQDLLVDVTSSRKAQEQERRQDFRRVSDVIETSE